MKTGLCGIFSLELLLILVHGSSDQNHKIVNSEYGLIRGERLETFPDKKSYWSFKGIPYAEPPVGELRYELPQKPKPWSDVLNATNFGNSCPQATRNDKLLVIGNEDCLYLNVFVPILEIENGDKLPVMVFIHGGGYYSGSSTPYRPDFLVANDVILVTLNYRLGAFGFFSLGTGEYPGNMGIKDQIEALRWVNRNIVYFGGDAKKVTLFGESVGGGSTHLLTLAPASKGLIKRAIMQSGSAKNNWVFSDLTNNLELAYKTAKRFGHTINNKEDLLKFFKNVDGETLIRETTEEFRAIVDRRINSLVWRPMVEVPGSTNPIFTKTIDEYLKEPRNEKFDVLIGHTSSEMLYDPQMLKNPELLKDFDESFIFQMPWSQGIPDFDSDLYKKVTKEVRDFYFPNAAPVNKDTLKQYIQITDDLYFNFAQYQAALLELKRSKDINIYYYIFSMETDLNVPRNLGGLNEMGLPGAAHLDDLFYLFRLNHEFDPYYFFFYENLSSDSKEMKAIRQITKIWTDFAKYGHPTPKSDPQIFKRFTFNERNFVNITNDGLIPGVNPLDDRMRFWENIYEKYSNLLEKKFNSARDEL